MSNQARILRYVGRVAVLAAKLRVLGSSYVENPDTLEAEELLLLAAGHLRRLHDFNDLNLNEYSLLVDCAPIKPDAMLVDATAYQIAKSCSKYVSMKLICDKILHSTLLAAQVGEMNDTFLIHGFIFTTDKMKKHEAWIVRIADVSDMLTTITAEASEP